MKKYEVSAILNGTRTKFYVKIKENINAYQVKLMLLGKYKKEDIIICDVFEIVDIDFTKMAP